MKKVVSLVVIVCSVVITMNMCTVKASAYWKKDSNGWKYDFESGYVSAKGAKYKIDGKWYYFDEQGYMKTGWCQDAYGEWYYAYSEGSLATDTVLYGYTFAKGGTMLEGITQEEINHYRDLMYKHTNVDKNKDIEIDASTYAHESYKQMGINKAFTFELQNLEFNETFRVIIDRDTEKVYSAGNGGFFTKWNNKTYENIIPQS